MEPFISLGDPIHSIISGTSHPADRKHRNNSKKNIPAKVHIGEILKGEILETHDFGIATVKLPIGTLKAQLTGHLLKGDQLVFIVQEIEPSLVLKIHSVAVTKSGKEISSKELIRILDLTDSVFFEKSIEFLKLHKQYIHRTECIALFEMFHQLEQSEYSDISGNTLLSCLFFFLENGLEFSKGSFSSTKYAFISRDIVQKILNNLRQRLNKDEYPFLSEIKHQLNSISDGFDLHNFFIIQDNTFASHIIKIYKSIQLYRDMLNTELSKELVFMAKYINAIEIVRIVLLSSAKPYTIRIPNLLNGFIEVSEVICDIFSSPPKYILELSDNVIIQIEIHDLNTNVKIIVFATAKNELIEKYLNKMSSAFAPNSNSIHIEYRNLKLLSLYSESENASHKNLTYVI